MSLKAQSRKPLLHSSYTGLSAKLKNSRIDTLKVRVKI